MALASTNISPIPTEKPRIDNSPNPNVATAMQYHVNLVIFSFNTIDAINGVNTTYKPVIKPVIAAPVLSKPRVWAI